VTGDTYTVYLDDIVYEVHEHRFIPPIAIRSRIPLHRPARPIPQLAFRSLRILTAVQPAVPEPRGSTSTWACPPSESVRQCSLTRGARIIKALRRSVLKPAFARPFNLPVRLDMGAIGKVPRCYRCGLHNHPPYPVRLF
jgi:hypothetical protein